jgi:3-oxoacyl-[acyl-carrier-protein] synthase II
MSAERMDDQFVAVTGIGMICPLGINTDACWQNMLGGKSGIRRIRRFDASSCLTQIAGELPDDYFEMEKEALPSEIYRHTPLGGRLSILSTRQALVDGALGDEIRGSRTAVIAGCGAPAIGDNLVFRDAPRKKLTFSYDALSSPAVKVGAEFGLTGPRFNVATACASGAFALGLGYDYVRRHGECAIAIGVETMIFKGTIDGFNQLMALSERNESPEKASRPFEKNRDGFVFSEGVCSVLLEPYERAVARGAEIYALMTGYAFTSESFNIIAPEPEGLEISQTMARAIENAAVDIEKIGYINAHGTSTPYNDLSETRAIKKVFGPRAYDIPVSSQKSMIGHSIGAAGAIEFAVTALSLHHQVLTPTINYDEPDPECDLDYVPNQCRPVQSLKAAISNSFGFGGHNASIVLEKRDAASG